MITNKQNKMKTTKILISTTFTGLLFLVLVSFVKAPKNDYTTVQQKKWAAPASADKIVNIFTNNVVVISYGTIYLKISALIFPTYPIYFISNGFFMALKKATYAMNLNIIRNVLLPVPTILLASYIGGSFKNFFWSYCLFNWVFAILLLVFVSIYIKNKINITGEVIVVPIGIPPELENQL